MVYAVTGDNPVPHQVSVSADRNTICSNVKVTFTATATNAGASPIYQWKKNNISVGNNSTTFTDSSFQNQDEIYCIVTANGGSATSNKIYMYVVSNSMSITGLNQIILPQLAATTTTAVLPSTWSGGTSPFEYSLDNVNISPPLYLAILLKDHIQLM